MRRLRDGFESLETRTPPASLLGVLADFFGQQDNHLLTDLPRSNWAGGAERDVVAEDHAPRPELSKVQWEPIEKLSEKHTSEVGEKPVLGVLAAKGTTSVTVPLNPFGTYANPDIEGTAQVTRNSQGASLKVKAANLVEGGYTNWAIIFNDPSGCEDGCGIDDVRAGRGDVFLAFNDGTVVGSSGKATFSGHFTENPDGPLTDVENAEIHTIVRWHGPKVPGLVNLQINTLHGGCVQDGTGDFECGDVAAANVS